MCLGTVGQVLAQASAGSVDVDAGGRVITASLIAMTDSVGPGDWVLMHSGMVLGRLTDQEATEALELRNATNEGVR
jgi:hydrogenase maturation factor